MYRKEINERSPLRILERSIHGGLGAGNLGVVMSRAGVGKTAFLVQVGLDDLMRQKQVLHISIGPSVDHVQAWYYALFDDLARVNELENRDTVRAEVGRRSVIQAFSADTHLDGARLQKVIDLYAEHAAFEPAAILIDGWSWDPADGVDQRADLDAFKAIAERLGAELWISAQTHRSVTDQHPEKMPLPCAAFEACIDVAVFLEPHAGAHVAVRILKDHDSAEVPTTQLELDPDTMRLFEGDPDSRTPVALPPSQYTVLSGGAKGAEAEFGACAERWGLEEINFSFPGRSAARTRGLVELTEAELKQGEVSPTYVEAQLHRSFPKTAQFQKMLQTIWHQVATAGEVFVVGLILPDDTVNGGTGWAAELGRHFKKNVHVFDQEKKGWFTWKDGTWQAEDKPRITRTRFTGTGTRFLSEEGRQAIHDLFTDTFGPSR